MKTSIILLLILLLGAACSPEPTVVPLVNPNPIPVTGLTPVATGVPVATDEPGGIPAVTVPPAATGYPVVTAGPVATSVPACTCPTPAKPQPGKVSPDHVICNCPVLLVTPPGGPDSTPQAIPDGGITLADNGKTFLVHPGDSFLLNLGMDMYDWTVSIDNQNVVSREIGVMPIRGAQGVYQAGDPGQAVLSAAGDPSCRTATPACMLPSFMFQVTIIVQ